MSNAILLLYYNCFGLGLLPITRGSPLPQTAEHDPIKANPNKAWYVSTDQIPLRIVTSDIGMMRIYCSS
jgi:hypothetical protein